MLCLSNLLSFLNFSVLSFIRLKTYSSYDLSLYNLVFIALSAQVHVTSRCLVDGVRIYEYVSNCNIRTGVMDSRNFSSELCEYEGTLT